MPQGKLIYVWREHGDEEDDEMHFSFKEIDVQPYPRELKVYAAFEVEKE